MRYSTVPVRWRSRPWRRSACGTASRSPADRRRQGDVYVVEVAARIPAGQMADLVSSATGISLFDIAIAQALGDPISGCPDHAEVRAARGDSLLHLVARRPPDGHRAGDRRARRRACTRRASWLPTSTSASARRSARCRSTPTAGVCRRDRSSARAALAAADAAGARLRVTVAPEAVPSGNRRPGARASAGGSRGGPRGCSPSPRSGRRLRFTGTAKLQRPVLTAARVSREFSPVCGCHQDVAHLTFRLLTGTRVVLRVVNTAGRPVATLVHDRLLGRGMQHFLWNGRTSADRIAANGAYRPELVSRARPHACAREPDRGRHRPRRACSASPCSPLGRAAPACPLPLRRAGACSLFVDGRRVLSTRRRRTRLGSPMAGPDGRRAPGRRVSRRACRHRSRRQYVAADRGTCPADRDSRATVKERRPTGRTAASREETVNDRQA